MAESLISSVVVTAPFPPHDHYQGIGFFRDRELKNVESAQWYTLTLEGTNLCLDISGARTRRGTGVIVWEPKAGDMANPPKNQLWRHTANGCFESCLNGLVLDIPNASKEAHSQLITWPADSKSAGLNQKWNLLTGAGPHADESGPIVSRLHGLCMAVAADKQTGEVKPGSESAALMQ